MNRKQQVLFLSLYTFGLTGGIEKVCRAVTKALSNFKERNVIGDYQCRSMYDREIDQRYASPAHFKGFQGKQLGFAFSTLKQGLKSDIVILSHINLLIFGWLIKKVKPEARIILFAHGIEIWKPLKNWQRRFLQQQAETIAVSNYTSGTIQKQHQIGPQRITILNNCLDPFFELPSSFEKPVALLERYGLTQEQKVLFTLTRLSSEEQYKGYDEVLAVLNSLPTDIHYLLGGKADAVEQERVKQLISHHRLQNRVTLTGFIADEEITSHFLLADVFVMPSKAEGFGISFIEAAACGCKVIAANQDGSSDALLNGKLGKLVDADDLQALNLAITQLLSDKNHEPLKQQEKTIEKFSFSNYQDKIKSLLQEDRISSETSRHLERAGGEISTNNYLNLGTSGRI